MTLLIAGLAVFFAVHLALSVWPGRVALTARFGELGRKGLITLGSILGFTLLIYGYRAAPWTEMYAPADWARSSSHALMPIAFILLAGSQIPSNVKRYVRHPMSLAVLIWAITHLIANGDLASVLLFGAFGLYALYDMLRPRGPAAPPPQRPPLYDVGVVALGLIAYGAAIAAHGRVFGVYVVG